MRELAVRMHFDAARMAELVSASDADPAAARADALVALCAAGLGGGTAPSTAQLVVDVDLGVLTGETLDGRCHIRRPRRLGRRRRLSAGDRPGARRPGRSA